MGVFLSNRACALWIFFLGLLVPTVFGSTCYYPNGEPSTDVPCYADIDRISCCSKKSICLDNGLCLLDDQPYTLYRSTCTDKGWGGLCTNICRDASQTSGVEVVHLNGTGKDSNYCCNAVVTDDGESICSTLGGQHQDPFKINSGNVLYGVAALSGLNSTTCNSSSSAPAANASNHQDNTSREVAIGAGVGVPLGAIALLSIGWALWERKERRRVTATAVSRSSWSPVKESYNDRPRNVNLYETGELPVPPPRPTELSGDNTSSRKDGFGGGYEGNGAQGSETYL